MSLWSRILGEPERPDPYARFRQQCAYEDEGAAAFLLNGKTREDCPYEQITQSEAWNFWVYGNESAQAEKRTLDSGIVTFCSTASDAPILSLPSTQAIESGLWKPRYVRVTERSS